jgi:hypothetical protein
MPCTAGPSMSTVVITVGFIGYLVAGFWGAVVAALATTAAILFKCKKLQEPFIILAAAAIGLTLKLLLFD